MSAVLYASCRLCGLVRLQLLMRSGLLGCVVVISIAMPEYDESPYQRPASFDHCSSKIQDQCPALCLPDNNTRPFTNIVVCCIA